MSAAEQQIMEQAQRLAAPLAAKIQQLDALLRRQPGEGGPAGEERVRIEQALAEAKANQVQFGRQFLAAREHAARQAAQAHAAAQAQQQQQAQAQNPQQRALQAQAHGDGSSAAGGSGVNSPALGSQGRSPAPGPGGAGSTPARTGSPAVVPSSGTASGAGGAAPSPLGQARPLAAKDGAQAASRQGSIPNQQAVPSPGPGQAQAQHRPSPGVGQAMATVPSLHTTPSIPATLSVQPAVPESYPNSSGPRPTLSQGLGTTPLLGTPAVLRRPDPLPRGSATPGSTTPGGSALGGVTNWEELLGMAAREGSRMNVNDDFGLGGGATAGTGVASGSGTAQGTGATPGFPSSAADDRLLTKRKVQELVGEIDANERLEGDVEDVSALLPFPCVTLISMSRTD